MLKDGIRRCSAYRFICKTVSAIGGVAILALATIGKLTSLVTVLWTASPLLLFWLMDASLAAEQRRCVDVLKKNPTKEDSSAFLWEGGDASIFRFFCELISLSIWPFYLLLFGLVACGGEQIVKANKEAAAEASEKTALVAPIPPYYQQGNIPAYPNGMPRSNSYQPPLNPAMQRFTPFPTPPRFLIPNRPPVTPPKTLPPASSPASSPVPR